MKTTLANTTISAIRGDISDQKDIEAVVNAANAELKSGGGVAGALHRAAGSGLAEECRPMAPIRPGEAVISGAHNLPNTHVIHCLGPVYGKDKSEALLLKRCYLNALSLAEQHNIKSIAFPAISTGIFGYPIEETADIIISALKEKIPESEVIKEVRFVLFSENDLKFYEEKVVGGI